MPTSFLKSISTHAVKVPGTGQRKETHGWRGKLNHTLHSDLAHQVFNALLLIDLGTLVVGMVFELQFLESKAEDVHDHYTACFSKTMSWPDAHHMGHYGCHWLHHWAHRLEYVSVFILTVFLLENLLLIVANGIGFFRNGFNLVDLTVVVVSIVFELPAVLGIEERANSVVGLVVFARSWRFIRIGHGIHEMHHHPETHATHETRARETHAAVVQPHTSVSTTRLLHQAVLHSAGDSTTGWRGKLNRKLNSDEAETFLNTLLIVDLGMLVFGMLLEVQYIDGQTQDIFNAFKQCAQDPRHCEGPENIEDYGDHSLMWWTEQLDYISAAVLFIFLIENLLLLVANGLQFLKNFWHTLDFVVIAVSLSFEIPPLLGIELEATAGIPVGLLVFARSWRFIRLGHGLHDILEIEENVNMQLTTY